MPGIHTVIQKNFNVKPINKSDFNFALHLKNYKVAILSEDDSICMALTYYDGYPFQKLSTESAEIIIEGLIYNISSSERELALTQIALQFVNNGNYRELIKKFVEHVDGDFIIQIFDKKNKKLLIFNDLLNRLSLYIYFSKNLFVVSKEIKTILNFIPKVRFNKTALAEYVIREYPLGNKTIFDNIHRFSPSDMAIVEYGSEKIRCTMTHTTHIDFSLCQPFRNKKESIEVLKNIFLDSVTNRVRSLKQQQYSLISDLSGGFDSRTVLAGLSKVANDISYHTFEYIRDESKYAFDVFSILGSPGIYQKLKFDNYGGSAIDERLTYITDGLVNYYTNQVCYHDMAYLQSLHPRRTARFCGLGGEFIRHPYYNFNKSLFTGLEQGLYDVQMPLQDACRLFKHQYSEFKTELEEYFRSYPEKMPEAQIKHLYYEYYNQYVGIAAEERERMHMWTVQPLWGMHYLQTIYHRLPLQWTGFTYHIQFMKAIDPRLLKVPILNYPANLNSKIAPQITEAILKLKKNTQSMILINFMKKNAPWALTAYKKINGHKKQARLSPTHLKEYYQKSQLSQNIFDVEFLLRMPPMSNIISRRIITLLVYFKQIEDKFGNKF